MRTELSDSKYVTDRIMHLPKLLSGMLSTLSIEHIPILVSIVLYQIPWCTPRLRRNLLCQKQTLFRTITTAINVDNVHVAIRCYFNGCSVKRLEITSITVLGVTIIAIFDCTDMHSNSPAKQCAPRAPQHSEL